MLENLHFKKDNRESAVSLSSFLEKQFGQNYRDFVEYEIVKNLEFP